MVAPGLATAASLAAVRSAIRAGISTGELDSIAEATIRGLGAVPNFMKEPGYRHTICSSVNDDVVHGIPGPRLLEPGDIVSIDSGAELGGWNGDAAISVVVPDPSRVSTVAERQKLSDVTEQSLWRGIAALASVAYLNHIGGEIEDY
ncbi:MAG: M24 family metallopeptidase, partial [Candidatus Saccharibacteria bacterium]|nr:M24 family metallopeptidase [Microbacteriaceae bacterium]